MSLKGMILAFALIVALSSFSACMSPEFSNIETGFLGGIHLDLEKSNITLTTANISFGQSVTILLSTRDQNGVIFRSSESLNVSFSLSGGTSTGTLDAVVDHHDGTYTATFTGTASGTPLTVSAIVSGKPLTGLLPVLTVSSGSAVSALVFSTYPSSNGNTDTQLATQPVIQAKDGGANTVLSFGGKITFSAYSDSACINLVPGGLQASTNPVSAVNGMASLSGIQILKTSVIRIGASDGVHLVCSNALNISPGAIASLNFSNAPSTVTNTDTALSSQPVVTAYDANSNVTTNNSSASITLTAYLDACITPVIFGLSASSNPLTLSSGVASFTNLKILKTNIVRIGASDGTRSICSAAMLVSPGAPSAFTISSGNSPTQTTAWLSPLSLPFVTLLKDANNNVIPSTQINWAVTSGGGTLSAGASVNANAAGLSSNTLTVGNPGSQTVTATVNGYLALTQSFVATATTSSFTQSNPFNPVTPTPISTYAFNSANMDFTGGVCRLIPTDQTDDDNSTTGFGGGTLDGLIWDSTSHVVRLGPSSGSNIPALISGLALWLKADSLSLSDGNPVSTWMDSSSNSNHATQPTVSAQPIYKSNSMNGHPALRFDGISSYLSSATGVPVKINRTTVFIVAQSLSLTQNNGVFSLRSTAYADWNSNDGIAVTQCTSPTNGMSTVVGYTVYGGSNAGGTGVAYNSSSTTSIPYVYTLSTAPASLATYFNGDLLTSAALSVPTAVQNSAGYVVSARAGDYTNSSASSGQTTKEFGNNDISEIIVYDSVLSDDNRRVVECYLAKKYGVNVGRACNVGTFTSRVMNALKTGMSWTTLSWIPTLPFLKPLPDSAAGAIQNETSTDYASLVGSTGTVGDNNLMSGIVGLWHLDETSWNGTAGEVKDKSGKGNNGQTINGVTPTTSGQLGGAAVFNGSNQSVSIPDTATLTSLAKFSFSTWVKLSSYPASGSNFIIARRATNSGGQRLIVVAQNGVAATEIQTTGSSWYGAGTTAGATSAMSLGRWYHITVTYDGAYVRIFLNGKLEGTGTQAMSGTLSGTEPLIFGGIDGAANISAFSGSMDESAVWARALDPKEVLQLYRRGANRVKYQVRVCTTPNAGLTDCIDDPTGLHWKGPDGTNQTYFSELNNNTVPLAMTGTVNKSLPSMYLPNFSNPFGTSQYFQYRTILESDDTSTSCNYNAGATWCSPELKSVQVDPVHYDTSSPTVIGKTGVAYYSLSNFTETLGASCASGIGYNLGVGADYSSATWYYWNGSAWTVANGTASQSNLASVINTNVASFGMQIGSGTVFFKAYLQSSGSSKCELDQLDLSGQN